MENSDYKKRGYLNDDFRLFHIKDNSPGEIDFHYHEFDKIVIFISGAASYIVEGRKYLLRAGDILFVSRHLIHKPEVDTSVIYDRVVIYISPEFLGRYSEKDCSLDKCFSLAKERDFCLIRSASTFSELLPIISRLENPDNGYGGKLLSRSIFLQLLIILNRAMLSDTTDQKNDISISDPKIVRILTYINENLSDDLSVEKLADMIYMSKYHFMRLFRELTGTTVHSYITQKRLLYAAEIIKNGSSAAAAARACGFSDYSAFHRAFKRQFGVTPRDL